ncbi:MAG TPA: hypothetical protein VLT89_03525 [Usitatibacter sp.]|nr:hypothetical protein [Usitatibacter sp.]
MKPDESRELATARTLLAEFERDAESPDAHARLSEALALLADIVDEGGGEGHVAKNLAGVYAAKVAASAEAMLERAGESSLSEMRHWRDLLEEFGRCGMQAPPAAAALAELSKRFATRYVGQLSKTEKQFMLKQLEESRGRKKR